MNRLGGETSPYLRQHRDNPVDWYPWGSDAFAAARLRDVPVLLSVGYSACHWCHVMAHECFEDGDVAAEMNRRFVNVKVDREERPDVDAVYMDAVQAMTGRGGWPMTVFLTPDGDPFYGGTYFPKPNFLQLLTAITGAWTHKREELGANTDALRQAISRTARLRPADTMPGGDHVTRAVQSLSDTFDEEWGGFGAAPKFPSTMSLDLLVATWLRSGDPRTREIVTTSLDAMASGGMYDHIGGGFARYSVDREWLVPHFEKMLYDQALLVRVYAHAAVAFDEPRWRQIVSETVEYVLRDLRQDGGGFSSAEDADSPGPDGHGHEGLFHTWTVAEVEAVLGGDAPAALEWWGITPTGNFEGRSIPNRLHARGSFGRPPAIEAARRQLFEARQQRTRPGLDDKVLTEWNALMVGALVDAGALLGRPEWIEAARAAARFLLDELRAPHGRWRRSWHAAGRPQARHAALSGDHAMVVDAFTRLGEVTGEASWIAEAGAVADTMLDHFWDVGHGGLFTTPDDGEALVARQKDLFDNATPSANSTAAVALYRLAALTGEARYSNHADRIVQLCGAVIDQAPGAFAHTLAAVALREHGITEVAVAGDRPDLVAVVHERWRPDVVLAWGERYDSPLWESREDGLAYVCRMFTCQAPQATADGLRAQLADAV
ncbi:MAG: thioredoxin domain-containing protein [Ilumatobacteraceae bacterium]